MYYTIYQTTNLTNGKIYIGYHSTKDLNDSYLGSGKILNQAITKSGRENFKREILYVFPSREEALNKELELVNEAFVQREDTYNMKIGGEGGWDHTHNDPIIKQKRLDGIKLAVEEGRITPWNKHDTFGFKGKTHSAESRKKIGEAKKLDETISNSRIKDYNNIKKEWGWKSKLSKMWGISHTQVNRFINDYVN